VNDREERKARIKRMTGERSKVIIEGSGGKREGERGNAGNFPYPSIKYRSFDVKNSHVEDLAIHLVVINL
jgi:hypothetical protein